MGYTQPESVKMLSFATIPNVIGSSYEFPKLKGIGTDKYAENSASETIYLQSIVYK